MVDDHSLRVFTVGPYPGASRWVAMGSEDQTVRIWEAASGRELTSIPFEAAVSSVRFSRDRRRLFVLLNNGKLHVLSAKEG